MGSRVIKAEAETTIRRSPEVVFGWLTDPARLPQWVTGLVESRPEGGAELGLGARSIEVISLRGKDVAMPSEVVELDGCRAIASRIETPDGPLVSRFVLDDLGDACRVAHSLTAEFSGNRWVPSFLLKAGMTQEIRKDLARLTRLVEADV